MQSNIMILFDVCVRKHYIVDVYKLNFYDMPLAHFEKWSWCLTRAGICTTHSPLYTSHCWGHIPGFLMM